MATETANVKLAAAKPKERGFGDLPCPRCGDVCSITIDLDDMDNCTCKECSTEFQLDQVRDIIAQWAPVIKRIDSLFA